MNKTTAKNDPVAHIDRIEMKCVVCVEHANDSMLADIHTNTYPCIYVFICVGSVYIQHISQLEQYAHQLTFVHNAVHNKPYKATERKK